MEKKLDFGVLDEARRRLIESGGRASQDLGAGRIVGQILIYLYLCESECSLDTIAEELAVSKASVSIAVRQLEQFGVVVKVWKNGDRRNYYRSADNIASALQLGLLALVRQKLELFSGDLDSSLQLIETNGIMNQKNSEYDFLQKRLARAKQLQKRVQKIIDHPVVKYLSSK